MPPFKEAQHEKLDTDWDTAVEAFEVMTFEDRVTVLRKQIETIIDQYATSPDYFEIKTDSAELTKSFEDDLDKELLESMERRSYTFFKYGKGEDYIKAFGDIWHVIKKAIARPDDDFAPYEEDFEEDEL